MKKFKEESEKGVVIVSFIIKDKHTVEYVKPETKFRKQIREALAETDKITCFDSDEFLGVFECILKESLPHQEITFYQKRQVLTISFDSKMRLMGALDTDIIGDDFLVEELEEALYTAELSWEDLK